MYLFQLSHKTGGRTLWTVTVVESENILFDSVTIFGDRRWPNNDVIDLINSRHVIIRNSNISTGDDCIAVVSHGPSAMFNITVEKIRIFRVHQPLSK
jgi:polygalacturonase